MFLCGVSVTVCVVCISVVNIFLFLPVFTWSLCVQVCVCMCEYECVCVLCACLPTLVSPVQIQASVNILESEISEELLRLRPASKTEWGKALSLLDV